MWCNDVKALEELSIKKPIGSQALVACYSHFSERTPLHLAVQKNNPELLAKLIEIMVQQYTPEIEEDVNYIKEKILIFY